MEPGNEPAKKSGNALWKQLLALVIGGVLLYFAFAGCDIEKTLTYMQDVNLFYVGLVFLSGVISHFIRAVRWIILLKPVAERNISLFNSFYAVMVGYAVNVVIPRGGEVARLVSINRLEKLPIAAVLPTMFIDRLIDLVLLAFLLGLTLTVLPKSILETYPLLVPGGTLMLVGAVVALLLLPHTAKIIRFFTAKEFVKKALPEKIMNKLAGIVDDFEKGASCLNNPMNYPIIAGLSILMWFFYWLNFYLMTYAFHLNEKVGLLDCVIAFTVGTVGVLIPTPGSAGGYHLLVQQGLVQTTGLDKEQALAFATVLHVVAFVGSTVIPAAICMVVERLKKK